MKTQTRNFFHLAFVGLVLIALTACGGGSSGPPAPMASYTIGGTVTGLAGDGLVLQNNAGGDLSVSAAGTFTFATQLADGAAYSVTVKTQPSSPPQNCAVTMGSGTVATSNVTNVAVACTTTSFTVGGFVSELTGSGLVLQNNGADDISISSAGAFTFATAVLSGANYAVTVKAQPTSPPQTCSVGRGSGTVGAADVIDVRIACGHHFAYATNAGDNSLSVYSLDSSTGVLTAVGTPVATGSSPYAIAGSPDKMRLYVVNEVSNDISAYSVNATSGALTPIAGSPFGAGTDPQALAFDPSGAYLYVANNGSNNLSAYSVNATNGELTPLSTATYATGAEPSAVSVNPDGKFLFVANNGGSNDVSVFAIAAGTGELTPVAGSPFPAGGNPHSLVYAASESVLYTANFDGIISTISVLKVSNTGALSAIQNSPFALSVDNYIATDPGGGFLYITTGGSVVGYGILDAGVLIALSGYPVAAGANAYSVTVDPSNQFFYVCNDGAANISGYVISPEPTTIAGSPFAAGNNPDFMVIL